MTILKLMEKQVQSKEKEKKKKRDDSKIVINYLCNPNI